MRRPAGDSVMGAAGAGEGELGIGGQVSERMSLAPYRTAIAESARWTSAGASAPPRIVFVPRRWSLCTRDRSDHALTAHATRQEYEGTVDRNPICGIIA